MSITLYTGWNEVRYTGVTQSTEAALASILPYLVLVYYWAGTDVGWITPTTMVTGNDYMINVSQDCVWTFEVPDEVPDEVPEGPFTEIVDIIAPSEAAAGDLVEAEVRLKNLYHDWLWLAVTGDVDAIDIVPTEEYAAVDPGQIHSFYFSFSMPSKDIYLTVFSWYSDGVQWVYDGEDHVFITLTGVYHLSVHVPPWAAGGYIEPGSGDYPAYSTVTLTAHPLSGYQFTSWGGDASGISPTYNLYMDSDKYVEAYFEKVPVPEFAGKIIKKELEYNGSRETIPVY